MIEIFENLSNIRFYELMCVYQEGNMENALERYSDKDYNSALMQVEQDFYRYLKDVFFSVDGAAYYVLSEGGHYISALRVEPYEDGCLIEALETRPEFRQMGYAKKLLSYALGEMNVPVYSHVSKENVASLRVHLACGFKRVRETVRYIDGSFSDHCCTLLRK